MQKFIVQITQENISLIDLDELECFILSENLSSHFKVHFQNLAKSKNKLVLGFSLSDVLAYHLDGLIMDLSKSDNIKKDFLTISAHLKNKLTGIICRNRRHEAMICSECEPDFLIFKAWQDGRHKIEELTSWYAEMFLIQSALMPMESLDYQSFKTDFVILKDVDLPPNLSNG